MDGFWNTRAAGSLADRHAVQRGTFVLTTSLHICTKAWRSPMELRAFALLGIYLLGVTF